MTSNSKCLISFAILVTLCAVSQFLAAQPPPPDCPDDFTHIPGDRDSPLFGTVWTVTFVKLDDPNPDPEVIKRHVCEGDQLIFLKVAQAGQAAKEFVVPRGNLARRWGVEHGTALEADRTPANRLCLMIDLAHGKNTEGHDHIFKFSRFVDDDDRVKLMVRFNDKQQNESCKSDPVHGGMAHAQD